MIVRPTTSLVANTSSVSREVSLEKAVCRPQSSTVVKSCRQFWKAGDFEGENNNAGADFGSHSGNEFLISCVFTCFLYTFVLSIVFIQILDFFGLYSKRRHFKYHMMCHNYNSRMCSIA